MLVVVSAVIILASIVLILIVLVQNPKGGGLSASFGGGSNQFGGVAQTNKFLDKATWTLALALLVFSISASMFLPRNTELEKSRIQKELSEISTAPVTDLPTPEEVKALNPDTKPEEKEK